MTGTASLSLVRSPLTAPVLDGTVRVPGVTLAINEAKSVNRNSQEMVKGAYDIAEMSLATYFKAREDGLPFAGLPLFTGRRFVHSGIHVRPGSGIDSPAQLAGRRVCLPQFWMTSSVWHRVLLAREYSLTADRISWVLTNRERLRSAGYPAGVAIEVVEGRLPGELLADGTVDAVLVPKRGGRLMAGAAFEAPFKNVVEAQRASYAKTGIFPIMHFIAMRADLIAEFPGLARDLCDAFVKAKTKAMGDVTALAEMEPPVWGEPVAAALATFGGDPWPYGLAANRHTLEAFRDSLIEQGLLHTRIPIDPLFEVDLTAAETTS